MHSVPPVRPRSTQRIQRMKINVDRAVHRHCNVFAQHMMSVGLQLRTALNTNNTFKFEPTTIKTYVLLVQDQQDTVPYVQPR